jgi:hypothetical protein
MPTIETDEDTRREWGALGVHTSRNDSAHNWIIEGGPEGLLGFATMLREFAGELTHHTDLQERSVGPSTPLRLRRSGQAQVNEGGIQGSPGDFIGLADIIQRCVGVFRPGELASVGAEYAPSSPYRLLLRIHPPRTDPASLGPQLPPGAG